MKGDEAGEMVWETVKSRDQLLTDGGPTPTALCTSRTKRRALCILSPPDQLLNQHRLLMSDQDNFGALRRPLGMPGAHGFPGNHIPLYVSTDDGKGTSRQETEGSCTCISGKLCIVLCTQFS